MSIIYSCVLSRRENIMLLESTLTHSYTNIVRNNLIKIQEGISKDSISIDTSYKLVYVKTKELILIVYANSNESSDEKEFELIDKLKEIIVNSYGSLNDFGPNSLKEMHFQKKLYKRLNHLIRNLNGQKVMNEEEIILEENTNNEKLLEVISSQETNQETSQQTVDSGNSFCTIRNCSLITVGVLIGLGTIYIVASLMKCKSLNLFCS